MNADDVAQWLAPNAPAREEISSVLRTGLRFEAQQRIGRRPGALFRLVLQCARRAGKPYSFNQLLYELEIEAARRDDDSCGAAPVESVNRVWELVTYHDKKRGRIQVPFGTLRNHLTKAKKILLAEFTGTPIP